MPDALDAAQAACIPGDRVHEYEDYLKANRLLLFALGTADKIELARKIIDANYPDTWEYAIYYGCSD